jgi:two-component system OmpR family sensor kinase
VSAASTGSVSRLGRLGPRSLGARVLAASVVLAIVVTVVFGVLVLAISSLHRATNREARSKDVTAATLSLEKVVLDLEAGLRGFVISGQPRLLAPWNRARPELRRRFAVLARLVADDPEESRQVREVARLVDAYEHDYGAPLIAIASESPAAARSPLASAEGQRRIALIRRRLTSLLATENARASASAASAKRETARALVLGFGGLGISAVLILLYGLYLTRAVAAPVREVAGGATRLAAGDLSARLRESGPGEVGELKRAFNAMAGSLEQSRVELEAQNERLRQSDRLKSELVSIVSHELRTPLTSILGFTRVIRTRALSDEDREQYLAIVEDQARRLSTLVEDFLDLQRIEEGHLELKQELIDMAGLLRDEAHVFGAQSAQHTFKLALPDASLPVYGDPSRLKQVVGNLLSNAIKYSPQGGEVEVAGEKTGAFVHIGVRDHGVGIPADQHERIFTKFFRGDAAGRGISGTGLGLAISREIVEAHGGRIGFTSAADAGSTFWVELPTVENGDLS